MNDATQRMASDSREMTIATWVGIVLLFVTLLLTLMANRAAVGSVKVAREIGEKQVRAYVGITSSINADSSFIEGGGIQFQVSFDVKNSGNSPATSYNYVAALEMVSSDFKATETDMVEPIEDGPTPFSSIASGETAKGFASIIVSESEFDIEAIYETGTGQKIVLMGVIRYDDVFGKPHRTRFCYEMVPRKKLQDGKMGRGIQFAWRQTEKHNDMD